MKVKSFFTKQRYIILAAGIVSFVILILLANLFGHDSETGVLFIDLSSSAVTIIATALVIEYFQYREESDRTHQVAVIAEEEIQAICYRVKLAIVTLYGYHESSHDQDTMESLHDVEKYLQTTTKNINNFYHAGEFQKLRTENLLTFKEACEQLQREIENIISLFGYALPYSLRAYVLELRSSLQISERAIAYINVSNGINTHNTKLTRQLTESIYKSAQDVLDHESRTHDNVSIARKQGRVGRQSS